MRCHTSSTSSILTCCQVAYHVLLRMYRMMRDKMQRQQTPPRQKASEDICCAQHPHFFCQKKKIIVTLELALTLKVWPWWVMTQLGYLVRLWRPHREDGRLVSTITISALPGCRWYFVLKNTVKDDSLVALVSPSLQLWLSSYIFGPLKESRTASSALSENCQSHVGIRFQNLAQFGNLEFVARIWHGCLDTRARFFWKSKNLAQKINLARGSPQSGNDLATVWQRSGNDLAI